MTCPECGCAEYQVIARGTRWGAPWEKRVCRFCRRTWRHTAPPPPLPRLSQRTNREPQRNPTTEDGVAYYLIRCPKCQSTNTRVTHTDRPVRYHKCQICGRTFKSVEVVPTPERSFPLAGKAP